LRSLLLIGPLVIAVTVGLGVAAIHRRLPPAVAARLLTLTIVAVTFAAAPAIILVALEYLAHAPPLADTFTWCREVLGLHASVPAWLGLPAVALLAAAAVRLRSVLRAWRRLRRPRSDGFEIVPSDSLYAYTRPGRGQVVVSSGLVKTLEPDELAVVLAHETAHAEHRHDRYVLTAELAAALVPFVYPLRRRLLFSLERWADEAAVARVRGDRPMVARTLARVALADEAMPATAVGIAGLGVTGRFEALLNPPVAGHTRRWAALMVAGLVGVTAAGFAQLHHLSPLVHVLCG
jgi:Zn-dependent protease with chaperone function